MACRVGRGPRRDSEKRRPVEGHRESGKEEKQGGEDRTRAKDAAIIAAQEAPQAAQVDKTDVSGKSFDKGFEKGKNTDKGKGKEKEKEKTKPKAKEKVVAKEASFHSKAAKERVRAACTA